MTTASGLSVLRIVLALVVGGYSADLVWTQFPGRAHHALLLLALAELIAAILFLIPGTVRLGGITLMIIFGVAAAFHVLHGEYSIGNLAVYGAAAFAVLSNWRRAS
jgi:hypothetical protein